MSADLGGVRSSPYPEELTNYIKYRRKKATDKVNWPKLSQNSVAEIKTRLSAQLAPVLIHKTLSLHTVNSVILKVYNFSFVLFILGRFLFYQEECMTCIHSG